MEEFLSLLRPENPVQLSDLLVQTRVDPQAALQKQPAEQALQRNLLLPLLKEVRQVEEEIIFKPTLFTSPAIAGLFLFDNGPFS